MERRTLIAVVLSFLVLYVYQAFFLPKPPVPATTSSTSASASSGAAQQPSDAGHASAPDVASSAPAVPAVPAPPAIAAVVGDAAEHDSVMETPKVRAVFTNRGARLKSWVLKEYRDSAGREVDLVARDVPPDLPLPFSLRVDEGDLTRRINSALFVSHEAEAGSKIPSLSYEFQDASGLTIRKDFRIDPQSYVVAATISVRQGDTELKPYVQWGPGPGDLGATGGGGFFKRDAAQPPQALFHDGKAVKRIAFAKADQDPVHEAAFRFAGVEDHYFIVAAVNTVPARVEYRGVTLPIPNEPEHQRQLMLHTIRLQDPSKPLQYYVGPKSFDALKAVDGEFVRAIDFGIWAWLAVPFLSVLKWIYGYVGNYGWAIIFLTILMNIVIFPLRHKSVVSMRKMQDLQPQLKAIQDRYADLKVTDPAKQKMNTEVMNLYREKGVNPASGCIPMVLTFPVLFAFYSLLGQSIELRGAPFAFWIHDLSKMDPYYVTPLLMGATMFWQQRITPATGDPAQQRMMMFMPIVFVAMFLSFPSGLAIYYFVNNIWAIGQQYFTNWLLGPSPAHLQQQAAAERRLKSAGSGRTERAEKKS